MPAEGGMTVRPEAPAQEPRLVQGSAAPGEGAAVTVRDVRRAYPSRRGEVLALDGMSLDAAPDEVVAVVGPSGCGKSTLLELVCGLQRPEAGKGPCAPAARRAPRRVL